MEKFHFLIFSKPCKPALLVGLAVLIVGFSALIAPFSWAQSTSIAAVTSEWTKGQIVKLDFERAKITLKHDAIKSIKMDAMTMPFKVHQASILQGLAVGDKVIFQVDQMDAGLIVTALKVMP